MANNQNENNSMCPDCEILLEPIKDEDGTQLLCKQCGICIPSDEIEQDFVRASETLGSKPVTGAEKLLRGEKKSRVTKNIEKIKKRITYLFLEKRQSITAPTPRRSKFPGYDESVDTDVMKLYRAVITEIKGLNSDTLLTACVYHVLDQHGKPTSLTNICSHILANTSRQTKFNDNKDAMVKAAARIYSRLRNQNIISNNRKSDPIQYITPKVLQEVRFAELNKLYPKMEETQELLKNRGFFQGKKPVVSAASLLFSAMKRANLQPIQAQIARAFGVSDVSIRTNHRIIEKILGSSVL